MCRLFGMHAGADAVSASFWLVDAADSLSVQSRRNPDGAGIGAFAADGTPTLDKAPLAAWTDPEFTSAAHTLRGTAFVAHVRHASTGGRTAANTHPFLQDGRLFAHNGVVGGLERLQRRLAELEVDQLVCGQTDSERVFALVTGESARHGGDTTAGLTAAVTWTIENLPVYALNLVLATATDLWALRYPATNSLHVLERPAGGAGTHRQLDVRGSRLRARAGELDAQPAVVVASEQMDDDPGWRAVRPGEVLHVAADLTVTSTMAFPQPPRHPLALADLGAQAARSQEQR